MPSASAAMLKMPDGNVRAVIECRGRARATGYSEVEETLVAKVEAVKEKRVSTSGKNANSAEALLRRPVPPAPCP